MDDYVKRLRKNVPATMGAIDLWVHRGQYGGGFVTYLLENDFQGMIANADSKNRENLIELGTYLYNHVPSEAHGSPVICKAWSCKKKAENERGTEEEK